MGFVGPAMVAACIVLANPSLGVDSEADVGVVEVSLGEGAQKVNTEEGSGCTVVKDASKLRTRSLERDLLCLL